MRVVQFVVVVFTTFVLGFLSLTSMPHVRMVTTTAGPPQPGVAPTFAEVASQLEGGIGRHARPPAEGEEREAPGGKHEPAMIEAREVVRRTMLRSLDLSEADLCQAKGRKQLIAGLNEYFWMRGSQEIIYPASWGLAGATYIKRAWSTPDDEWIDRRTSELYVRGFFTIDDIGKSVRPRVTMAVAGETLSRDAACERSAAKY